MLHTVSPDVLLPTQQKKFEGQCEILMGDDGDLVAGTVLAKFDELPSKAKPRRQTDGSIEWVPLTGIVLSYRMDLLGNLTNRA